MRGWALLWMGAMWVQRGAAQPSGAALFIMEHFDASLGTNYSGTVGGPNKTTSVYTYAVNANSVVRVVVRSPAAQTSFPLLVVVREIRSVLSWQLPFITQSARNYSDSARTLCPLDSAGALAVELASASPTPLAFSVSAALIPPDHFRLSMDVAIQLDVTPSEPAFLNFTFPAALEDAIVEVQGYDSTCVTISVQKIGCPVYDQDTNVNFFGTFQTMTTMATIPINKETVGRSLYVVAVVKGSDLACGGLSVLGRKSKRLIVVVRPSVARATAETAVGVTASVLVGLALLAVVVSLLCDARDANELRRQIDRHHSTELDEGKPLVGGRLGGANGYGGLDSEVSANLPTEQGPLLGPAVSVNAVEERPSTSTSSESRVSVSNIDEYDTLPDAQVDKSVIRAKPNLRVSDLARKSYKARDKKYRLYHWNLLTISIFYVLPVIQLVLAYQAAVYKSGNEDLCFYNFRCAIPLGGLFAFNSVFSNIGYVTLGLLFLVLVKRRHVNYLKIREAMPKDIGLPRHFGIFYAIGLSMVMEGILSGCYHVCPNYSNFQFDTAFMYMLGALGMLEVYQMRHPDINASSHVSYVAMAGLILLSVVGVLGNGLPFWLIFSGVYVFVLAVLWTQFYYKGQWKLGRGFWQRLAQDWRGSCSPNEGVGGCLRPAYPERLVFLLVGVFLNVAFLVLGLLNQPSNFSSWLLTIFISNLLMYVLYYLAMKLRHGEKLGGRPAACLGLASAAWGVALYFYFSASTDWTRSPAQSREANEPCILLGFYDAHDVWHFVSALSLFLSFLLLLVIDDDLTYTPTDAIPVF